MSFRLHNYDYTRLSSRWSQRRRRPSREGMVLVLVLIVVAMLSLAGFTFTELMFTERKAARLHGREMQAEAAMQSGIELLRVRLDPSPSSSVEAAATSDETTWHDVEVFRNEARGIQGFFTVTSPGEPATSNQPPHLGPVAEGGLLNLNSLLEWERIEPNAGRTALASLPGMNDELADAILDWLDPDSQTRPFGAEADLYGEQEPGYTPRNGPIASLDELLMVRGVTPELLFGPSAAPIGSSDDGLTRFGGGSASVSSSEPAPAAGSPLGLANYLTLWSAERNVNQEGQPRVDLNHANLGQLHAELSRQFDANVASFVVLYRQHGPSDDGSAEPVDLPPTVDFAVPASREIESPLELIGARVAIPEGESKNVVESPFKSDAGALTEFLPKLLDGCTVWPQPILHGRINLLAAPPEVLAGFPGLSPVKVDAILSARSKFVDQPSTRPATLAWLVNEGVLELSELRQLLPYATVRSDVHRASVFGYLNIPSPVLHGEVVIDATVSPPLIRAWRPAEPMSRSMAARRLGLPWLAEPAGQN